MLYRFPNLRVLASTLAILLSTVLQAQGNNHFYGITASNSIPNSSYKCRSQTDWDNLANTAKTNGFQSIRIVGFDCGSLDLASSAAAAVGLTVMAGIYVSGTIASSSTTINADVQTFRSAYGKYGEGRFKGLTIGNEATDQPENIAAKVDEVRNYLRSIQIKTPVSTVHNWVKISGNPLLCKGDFVGANAHAFYDGGVSANQAGDFVFKTVVPALRKACPSKPIIITESGWPSRGAANGKAVASIADERTALLNLNCAAATDSSVIVYAFEADDQTWKGNDDERSFGIFSKIPLKGDALDAC